MTYCCEVKYSSGVKTRYETEGTKEEFLASMFGSGLHVPNDVQVIDLDEPKEEKDATQDGKVQKGDLGEHQDGDGGGKTTKASSSDSPKQGGQVKPK